MSRAGDSCAILIPFAHNVHLLGHGLASLRRSVDLGRHRAIVGIDDPPLAARAEACCREAGVDFLTNPEPLGYSGTVERLLAHTTEPYVAFVNFDLLLTPGWLDRLLARLRRDEGIGLLAARVVSGRSGGLDYCGMAFGLGTCIPLWHGSPPGHPLSGSLQVFQAVPDCCAVMAREHIERIGPRDPRLRVAWGDIDYCLRIGQEGLACACDGGVSVLHMRHGGGPRRMLNVDLGRAYLFEKWAGCLRYDLRPWLARSFGAALPGGGPAEAILVDLLDPFDEAAYLGALEEGLGARLAETRKLFVSQPVSEIYLPALLGPELAASPLPLIVLSRSVSLARHNLAWSVLRQGRGDLFVDLYGNVVPLEASVAGSW